MRPSLIQAELKDRKITQMAIADELQKSSNAISLVIHRQRTSRKIANKIADLLDMPLLDVFPEYQHKTLTD